MNPIARLQYLWRRKEEKENKISLMFYVCLYLIVIVDFIFGYIFYYESKVMLVVNTACLLCNLFIYHLYEQNKRSLGLYLLLTQLYIFMIIATIVMGWDYGFQQYLYGILCIFFLPFYIPDNSKNKSLHIILAGLLFIVTYYILSYICHYTRYSSGLINPTFSVYTIHALNSSISMAAVSAFCILSSMINNEDKRRLKRKADFDELTTLYNRYGLNELLTEMMDAKKSFYIAIADLDYFKNVNDTYGHNAGDEILQALANKFLELNKHLIKVGRWGGEEFLIVGDSKVSGKDFKHRLDEIREEISKIKFKVGKKKINITVSIGVAKFNHKKGIEDNVNAADNNLYKAKETGRNKVVG